MREFIETQYRLYKSGGASIGIENIQRLADMYLTPDGKDGVFGEAEE